MNRKLLSRLSLDFVMTVLIVLAFGYPILGNTVHELVGFSLLAWFSLHVKWNGQWFLTLRKGKYNGVRKVTVLINLLLVSAALMMILSGLANSHLLSALCHVDIALAPRELHTAAAYWFLILMSAHLGLHWKMIMAQVRLLAGAPGPSPLRTAVLRVMTTGMAVYGMRAFVELDVAARLLAWYSFDFWDPDTSVAGFFAQYLAIIGLCACLTVGVLKCIKNGRRQLKA